VLTFFRVNPAKRFNQPDFFYPGRLFLSIVGSTSGKPGETGRGGGMQKNSKIRRVFFSRYLAANDVIVRVKDQHDIAITNIARCMAYTRGVGGGASYIAQ